MADYRLWWQSPPRVIVSRQLREHPFEVEGRAVYAQLGPIEQPLTARTVSVDLDAVAVGVGHIDRLATPMIEGVLQRCARLAKTSQPVRQGQARWYQDGEMIQPGCARYQHGPSMLGEGE